MKLGVCRLVLQMGSRTIGKIINCYKSAANSATKFQLGTEDRIRGTCVTKWAWLRPLIDLMYTSEH